MKTKLICLSLLASTCLFAWTSALDVSNGSGKNFFPQIVSDGDGGAIITWLKKTNGCYEVHAQRVTTVSNQGHLEWNSGSPVPISDHSAPSTDIGHRLNHHIIPSTSNSAIYFWANHFNTAPTNDPYPRGYYLQKTDGSGNLKWPIPPADPNPVQAARNWPEIPPPNDGEPISICPDGEGGCVVAMKAKPNNCGEAWKIVVNRYDEDGTQHENWPSGGRVVGEPPVTYHQIDDDPELDPVYGYIGCPKVVQWENDQFMVLWTTVTDVNIKDSVDNISNSVTRLHICRIDGSDGSIEEHDDETVKDDAHNARPIYHVSDYYGPWTYLWWYWWIPDFQVVTNASQDKLYVTFIKRFRGKQKFGDTPIWHYREDYLYVLEYSSPSFFYTTSVEGWSVRGKYSYNPNGDMLPLRSPSIICVNNAAVVCVPRATDNPPTYQKPYQSYRTYHLKLFKIYNGSATSLGWNKVDGNYHTPQLIADPSGGLILSYSKYLDNDYSNGSETRVRVERHNPITRTSPNPGWPQTPGNQGTNTSPRIILSDNNHVIVTWAASDDGKESWRIMTQRYDMSGN